MLLISPSRGHPTNSSFADTYTHEWDIHDPALTEKGFEQCKSLASDLKSNYSFPRNETLIVVSPLKRTLQTFQQGLGWLVDEGVPVQLRAEWQVIPDDSTESRCQAYS